MAKEDVIKALIDAELSEDSIVKLEEQLSDSIKKGSSKGTKFNFKKIGSDILKGFSDATGTTQKVYDRSQKAAKDYAKQQQVVSNLVNMQGKGYAKAFSIVKETSKLGVMGAKGMLANINPYVAALQVALEVAKFMADQFERMAKESAKFVGQGSIFTDEGTMRMMQMTGQTATQAQGTQRSLDMLGLNFDNLQQGRLTGEQAALFEELRLRELEKLEQINEVAGPMFKDLQQITLGFSLFLQDINDWITLAFANAKGFQTFIDGIKQSIDPLAALVKNAISALSPILSVFGSLFNYIVKVLTYFMPILNYFIQLLSNTFGIMEKILMPILDGLSNMVETIGGFVNGFINGVIETLGDISILGFKPFDGLETLDLGSYGSSSSSSVENATTNNYIYGTDSMSESSTIQSTNNLFTNSYTLVND